MGSLNEKTPLDFDLPEEHQEGFDESGKLPDRLKRYAFARDRALINLSELDKFVTNKLNPQIINSPLTGEQITVEQSQPFIRKLENIRPRLAQCGDYLVFKNYYTAGKVRLTAANFCMVHLLCPLCAIRRGSKSLEAYIQRFGIIKASYPTLKLSMLTLTVKNGDDLKDRFNHLKKSLSVMMERRRKTLLGARGWHSEFAKIAGLVGSIEITKDGGQGEIKETGWHPHAHIMILHYGWLEYVNLQAEWLKITGDSHVLNVTPAQHPDNPAQDFLEVFKYALKFSELTPVENLQAYQVINDSKLLFSAGLFRGVVIPESQLDEELDDLPYIELFYEYLANLGYSLKQVKDSEDFKAGHFYQNSKEKPKNTVNNKLDIVKFLNRA
jgi:hypothetical protein